MKRANRLLRSRSSQQLRKVHNLTNETPAPTSRQKPKRIDSAAPQQQTYSGVRARRSPNVASPDTSYNTIIKGIPPSNGTTKLPGPAGTLGTANANQPQGTTTQATPTSFAVEKWHKHERGWTSAGERILTRLFKARPIKLTCPRACEFSSRPTEQIRRVQI